MNELLRGREGRTLAMYPWLGNIQACRDQRMQAVAGEELGIIPKTGGARHI